MNFNKIKLFVETNTMDIRSTNDATNVYALWCFFGIKDKLVGILSNGIVLKVNEFNMKWKINSSMKILNMEQELS